MTAPGARDADVTAVMHKVVDAMPVAPNLVDYEAARAQFSWDAARARLAGLPAGGVNIAHEAVDRHATGDAAQTAALRWLGRDGTRRTFTYAELAAETSRFANVLAALGVHAGDVLFMLAGRVPALYIGVLGALKHRVVVSPLFAAFGPDPIATRIRRGEGSVLVTTAALYRRKVAAMRAQLPSLSHVLVVRESPDDVLPDGTHDLAALLAAASPVYHIAATDPETPALLHFTSGTTGSPKGALHVHAAVTAHRETARVALDLRAGDVFWCTADPGWVTGTSYGIIAPLCLGATLVVDEGDYDAERWYDLLAREAVTVWYTAPTAVRMMMKGGSGAARRHVYPALRFIASVGEPLNPQGVHWGIEAFGQPIDDNWWQTETGGIMIAISPPATSDPVRWGVRSPGSTTRSLPARTTAYA